MNSFLIQVYNRNEWDAAVARSDDLPVILHVHAPTCKKSELVKEVMKHLRDYFQFVNILVDAAEADTDFLCGLKLTRLPAVKLFPCAMNDKGITLIETDPDTVAVVVAQHCRPQLIFTQAF